MRLRQFLFLPLAFEPGPDQHLGKRLLGLDGFKEFVLANFAVTVEVNSTNDTVQLLLRDVHPLRYEESLDVFGINVLQITVV